MNKSEFDSLIKLASKPLKASKGRKKKARRSASYSGKRTRQRNAVNTSGKHGGKSREGSV